MSMDENGDEYEDDQEDVTMHLQLEDEYSFALIVIELYTPRPILATWIDFFPSMVQRVYSCSDSMLWL